MKILRVPIFIWSARKEIEQTMYEIRERENRFQEECVKALFKEKK